MSHFCVVVVGNDYEAQLAPYHEFECTGRNDQYVVDHDVTDELLSMIKAGDFDDHEDGVVQGALAYYGLEDKTVFSLDQVDRDGDHKHGFAILDADGNIVQAFTRTNPNKKWDWYQLGGRWRGYFRLLPGSIGVVGSSGAFGNDAEPGWADQVRKGDVDWQGMRADAGAKAGSYWDRVRAASPDGWESWDSVRERITDVDQAREFYNNQPGRLALRTSKDRDLIWVEDDVLVTREAYVKRAEDAAGVSFALLVDGKWMERGEMGWFGMHTDDVDYATWCARVRELIDGLPDDTILSAVDCHI